MRWKPYPSYKVSGIEWLGVLPDEWLHASLRRVCKSITDGSHFSPENTDEGRAYVTVRNLINGEIDLDSAAKISESDFERLVKAGCRPAVNDVLFSKDGTVGKVAIVKDNNFVALSSLAILSPNQEVLDSRYLYYFLQARNGEKQVESLYAGAALKRITLDAIVGIFIPVPNIKDQTIIAAFLDRETAKLDTLIANQEKLIELLQEKRQAVITHAVTKGLDPDVPMKDSGVEWLGEVPAHWNIKQLKRISTCNDDVLSESTDPSFDIEYVDIGSVSSEYGIEKTESMIFENAPSRARRKVKSGDVIVSTVRTYLKAIAPITKETENVIVSTGFAVIRPTKELDPTFAKYSLHASHFLDQVVANSMGVSYPAINSSQLISIKVPTPTLAEQVSIGDFLNCETAKIDELIKKANQSIELAKEHRSALISAAVTGKIDVREAA